MTDSRPPIIEGDTVSLTVKGQVVPAGTPGAATVRIIRAGNVVTGNGAVSVDLILDRDADVTYDIKSKFKNGVHVAVDGSYWMRRPDGWHAMTISGSPNPNLSGRVFVPSGLRRLREDTDT